MKYSLHKTLHLEKIILKIRGKRIQEKIKISFFFHVKILNARKKNNENSNFVAKYQPATFYFYLFIYLFYRRIIIIPYCFYLKKNIY